MIATLRVASLSNRDESIRVSCKRKARTGVQFKQQGKNTPKHHGTQRYCVTFRKSVIPEQKYIYRIALRNVLESVMTRILSRMDWEDP